jgi:hypothetical protein
VYRKNILRTKIFVTDSVSRTSAEHHAANSWYTNLASTLALIFAYGSIPLVTMNIYVSATVDTYGQILSEDVAGQRYGLDFSAWGFIGLGE